MKKLTIFCLLLCIVLGMQAKDIKTTKTLEINHTQALSDKTWEKSVWLSACDAPIVTGRVNDQTRAADGASWFVSTIKNHKKVVKAVWMTAGLGVYDIYVNGIRIGNEFLKPGFTHFQKTKRSFTYDITKAFVTKANGKNTLAAEVTPGWWADKIVTVSGKDGFNGKKCAFRGVLELTFADGTKMLYGTNTKEWSAGIAGKIKHAAIFDGEEYDAREKDGFADIEKLSTPEVNSEFKGQILPSQGAEIYLRHDLILTPVRAYVWKDVEGVKDKEYGKVKIVREYQQGETIIINAGEHLVIDFGQNCAAVPSFVFKAEEGTKLTCLPAELLNDGNGKQSRGMDGPEGSVHRLNLRIHQESIRMDYTFAKTKDMATYMPRHTFFGYRFLSLSATGKVSIKSITSVPVSSISKEMEIGNITTGNKDINKLISNTLWGQRSNYLSVPTDCPQRNERLGWTADTQVFAETGTFFANTKDFFHKWMRDLCDSQSQYGGFPGVAPYGQYGSSNHEMMRVGWADAGIIVPWTIWKQFGDRKIVDDNWQAMERYMDHINATKYDHQALSKENGNYQWGDWLSYEPLESCSGQFKDKNGRKPEAIRYWSYLCASYWAIDARNMYDMAKATGHDAAKYKTMTKEATEYLKEQFMNADGTFKDSILNTMQTPALFALKNNLVEGEAKENMKQRLRNNFKAHDNCLQTGFLGTSILMNTLRENNMNDIAYELLFQHKNPSWLYSIDNGATTIWERWNSYTKDRGMGPRGMNSFNHYAYGAVCEWIWKTAAGIAADNNNPGFKHIIMAPQPDKRLGFIDAEYHSEAGVIKSKWKYEGNKWIWTFTIPNGSTASVTIPGESSKTKEYKAGTYTIEKDE